MSCFFRVSLTLLLAWPGQVKEGINTVLVPRGGVPVIRTRYQRRFEVYTHRVLLVAHTMLAPVHTVPLPV